MEILQAVVSYRSHYAVLHPRTDVKLTLNKLWCAGLLISICHLLQWEWSRHSDSSWLSVVRPLEMFQKYQEFTTEYHFTSVTTVNEKRPTLKSPRPPLMRSMRKVSKVPPNRVAPLRSTAWTERFPLLHAWTTTNIPASRRYTGQPRVVAAIISLLPRTCSVNGHINARTHTSLAALPMPAGAGFKQKSPFPSNRNGIYIYICLYIFIYFKAATKCTVCLFVFDNQREQK